MFMKNTPRFFCLTLACSTLMLTVGSCKQGSKEEDSKELAVDKNEAKFEDNKEEDAKFLVNVAEFDLQQSELGKLTALKSNNPEIKAFGKMMETMYHQKINDVQDFSAKRQISVPVSLTEQNKDDYNELNKKDIEDFDRFYIDHVVDKHKEAIDKCTDKVKTTADPDLKRWLSLELASLREHLDEAMTLQSKLKK